MECLGINIPNKLTFWLKLRGNPSCLILRKTDTNWVNRFFTMKNKIVSICSYCNLTYLRYLYISLSLI